MSEMGLGCVKTQRRVNCGEKYFFGSPLWKREEHTELRCFDIRETDSLPFARFCVFTARVKSVVSTARSPLPVFPAQRTCRCVAQTDANGMDRPRSRPQRVSECAGGSLRAGAAPCLAGPRIPQSPPLELIWVRTHFTWLASIRWVPSCCESGSRAGASHQGLQTSHLA
jgi:hypothetical protein